jgi:hypothetical protein
MIRLYRTSLADTLTEQLETLTSAIEGQPTAARVAEARRLWRGRRQVRAELKAALGKFASGRLRCMYCGDNQGTDIDHYEPLSAAPRRTFHWPNHLLACSACNSHHKRDRFPLAADGTPLLLDPTADDPFAHLALALSVGRYVPLTARGEATIAVCQLNRDILCRGRQVAYDTVTIALEEWSRAYETGNVERVIMVEEAIQEQPFADVAQAMLRYVDSPGVDELFHDRSHLVAILRHPTLRAGLLRTT